MDHFNMILLLIVCVSFVGVRGMSDEEEKKYLSEEHRLLETITAKINPNVPPHSINTTTNLKFGVALLRILGLDEKESVLTTKVWVRMLWKDKNLRWNPDDFGGILSIHIPSNKIWQPDITLFNDIDSRTHMDDVLSVVYNTGDVLLIPPMILKSTCTAHLTYYPYDTQYCQLKFGSWTNQGDQISLDFYEGIENIDLSDYIPSIEWDLLETAGKVNVKYYPCCTEPYPDMTFNLTIARKGGLQALSFVSPLVFLAILCPLVFLLPYSETQRFSLGGSLLICLAIMISSFERIFPTAHGSFPVLAQYYMCVLILLVLSLILSAIITNIADRATRPYPLPVIIRKIFVDGLGKLACVTVSANYLMNDEGNKSETTSEEQKSMVTRSEWRALAQILDRVFFVIYIILTVLLSMVFLIRL